MCLKGDSWYSITSGKPAATGCNEAGALRRFQPGCPSSPPRERHLPISRSLSVPSMVIQISCCKIVNPRAHLVEGNPVNLGLAGLVKAHSNSRIDQSGRHAVRCQIAVILNLVVVFRVDGQLFQRSPPVLCVCLVLCRRLRCCGCMCCLFLSCDLFDALEVLLSG